MQKRAAGRILDFGFWILDFGFWILDFGLKKMMEREVLLTRQRERASSNLLKYAISSIQNPKSKMRPAVGFRLL
jgi:hypothetical protein